MIHNQPLISVIMSVYNGEATISRAINSITSQTYQNLEFLIVDDFSTDSSLKVLKEFEDKDKRIKVYQNKKNIGLTKSLNFLIGKSKGEFIARQDADDVSYDKRLSKQFEIISEKNFDAVSSRANRKDRKKKIPNLSFYMPKKIIIKLKNPFIHGTLLIRKKVLLNLGCYDERFYFAQDYKLMKDFLDSKYKIGLIKEPLYLLNEENNISKIHRDEQRYYAECVKKNKDPQLSKK